MIRICAALLCFAFLLPAPCRGLGQIVSQQPTSPQIYAEQQEQLVVTILGPEFAPRPLPISFQGKRPRDFGQLRRWLRGLANPELYPDKSQPVVGSVDGADLRPSRRNLLIQCHQDAMVGWVQAVLQLVTFVPGQPQKSELRESPLIRRISFELLGTRRRLPFPLPTDKGLSRTPAPPRLQIRLRVPRDAVGKPATERLVHVALEGAPGHDVALGMIKGVAPHSRHPGRYSLQLEPPTLLLALGRHLAAVRQRNPRATTVIRAYPQTPFAVLFDVAEACKAAGFAEIALGGIPADIMGQLERGQLKAAPQAEEIVEEPTEEIEELEEPEEIEEEVVEEPVLKDEAVRKRLSAVDRGLAWLARSQAADGHWDTRAHGGRRVHDVGVTGLALLAFLGEGNTHRSGRHKDTVRKGLRWLKSIQDAEGAFGLRGDPSFTYSHAIATVAMCEAYGLTRSGVWKTSAQNALNFIGMAQNPYKGWRYGVRPGDNDTSVTSWMVMALKAGKLARLEVSAHAFDWALNFLDEMTDAETGRTGYMKRGERPVREEGMTLAHPAENSESLTAAAILSRVFMGQDPRTNATINKGLELLRKRLPRWEKGHVDMVYWYFGTLSSYQAGGTTWLGWSKALRKALLDSQRKDGAHDGSWDAVGPWGQAGGRVYSTAMMTMCLEVYYRYGRVFGTKR